MEDAAAQLKEGDEEKKLQGIDNVVGKLRGSDIQPQKNRDCKTQDRGRTQRGIDSNQ